MTDLAHPRRLLGLAAALALALRPAAGAAQTCEPNDAARDLLAASYLDTALNPSDGEDMDFLKRESGAPNIMVLFDSSGSMRRLPPDGPGRIGGTLPPGHLLVDPSKAAQQTAAKTSPSRVVGCGLDPVSASSLVGPGSALASVRQRAFHPPCGKSVTEGLVNATYAGATTHYAAEMNVCPYFSSSSNQTYVGAGEAAGYDPNFYNNAAATDVAKNGSPVFFGRDLIFHDTAAIGGTAANGSISFGTYAWDNGVDFKHNFGDGWGDWTVHPYQKDNNSYGTIADFCSAQGTTMQGTGATAKTYEQICNTCLTDAGWYYDGILLQATEDGVTYQYPSLWYTGNYLTFFPPKFLVARKIVKDIIAVQSRIRLGISRFSDASPGVNIFQDFNPSCYPPATSNFESNRSSFISNLNNAGNLSFAGGAPSAKALFELGRYYHTPGLTWFGEDPKGTLLSPTTENQFAICYSCQASTVIMLTDGLPNADDGSTLPAGTTTAANTSGKYAGDVATGILGITKATCPSCGSFTDPAKAYLNNLPKVAWYLNNMDLRDNTETTADCKGQGGKQVIQTYTVGFGTSQFPTANTVLRNTAEAGGGMFVEAEDPATLKDGINYILREISNRSTSFSVATVSTLQTTSGRAVIVPRFDPNKTAHWDGHLFRFDLYSEFVNACEPKGAGDLDCDGQCVSAFLADQSDSGNDKVRSLVSEAQDGNGTFVRNQAPTQALCSQAPACGTGSCTVSGNASANPFWDAGKELAAQEWKTRKVYTAVDTNGDGDVDGADGTLELTTAKADKIAPYLALGTSATGQSVCADLSNRLAGAGDLASAALVTGSKLECTKTIIRFALGADIFNSLGKTGSDWPPTSQDAVGDRAYKLGDIFHSSPVVVDPPLPRDGILCPAGLSNQCISSLWATPTPGGEAGYDAFAKSGTYKDRDKIILVGANDGFLHAFHGGKWIANPTPGVHSDAADDGYTDAVDESLPPFNGHYDRGTAKELWAFLPPDMIAKLPLLMGSKHQYYVDGTAMVRDVWVDGTANGLPGATTGNLGSKEGGEFHTVAVVGERRGGTRYFALDVTDATNASTGPTFLWIYPQPNEKRSLEFGATYDDFLPVGPPIGPVRLEVSASTSAGTPTMAVPGVADPVPYEERWVVLLAGGFDPQYVRGRGVFMLDVWTGKELFDFSYPEPGTTLASDDPRLALRFPIAATPGMVPWGQNAKRSSDEKNDHFFDTATFGDTGGQLWVLRFNTPGKLTGGKVTNWWGGRVFQMGGAGNCKFCGGQPFFYITANMAIGTNMAYRVFAGTGDRFNLLDKYGGECGPDNIRACAMRGCTVTLDSASNFLQAKGPGSASWGLSEAACGGVSGSRSDGTVATCEARGRARVQITNCPGSLSTTSDFEAACELQTDGYYRCSSVRAVAGDKLAISDATNPITLGNWYLSLLVFEDLGDRAIFTTEDLAKKYDGKRLSITQTDATTRTASTGLVLMSAKDDAPTGADATSTGWAVYYDHEPSITIDNHVFTIAWQDERTSSGTGSGEGLITWNTTQPTVGQVAEATEGGCKVSKCTAESRRVAYHYGADPETGLPYPGFKVGGKVSRSIASYLLVPSQADQTTVFVNQKGQVAVGLTAVNPEKGASNVGMGDPIDPVTDMGFVEVSEELHACRHPESGPVCR